MNWSCFATRWFPPGLTIEEIVGIGATVAGGISWQLSALLIRWAPQLGLVDLPSARKVHTHPIPKGGGLAFIAGVLLALGWFMFWPYLYYELWWGKPLSVYGDRSEPLEDISWLIALGIAVLGLADDIYSLPWQLRLTVQACIAGEAVWLCLPLLPWWVSVAATVWLVAQINAFNMLDNMDALSGGVALIGSAFLLVVLGILQGSIPIGLPYGMLCLALVGFLHYNRHPARIFMGDVGSTFLGFVIGYGALKIALLPDPPWSPLVSLCICAVPIYDQTTTVLLRLCQGRSPFHGDKQHLSHRLVARGLSQPAAVGVIHLLALVSGGVGLILYHLETWWSAGALFAALAAAWVGLAVWEFVYVARPQRET
jgi:UDP-GlcNAc:undecaprenyl-phosphate GlcNAc-1-phosphate transferase